MLFKGRYGSDIRKAQDFLRSYAGQIFALESLTKKSNETVTKALDYLKDQFVFAVTPRQCKQVKVHQDEIARMYTDLEKLLKSKDWDEHDVLELIDNIEVELKQLTAVVVR